MAGNNKRGFAAMDENMKKKIASDGGKAKNAARKLNSKQSDK